MIIGHCLYGQDNDSYMIEDETALEICPKCKYLKDFNYHNPFYKIKNKSYDFSHPYDIGSIVSLKFKEFCLRENYEGIIFKEFEKSFGFYQFIPKNILEFDDSRTGTHFKNYCEVCKNYEEVIGANPAYIKNIFKELEDGFYRTDLLFGSKSNKNPLIIVAPKTHAKLKKERMKGLVFKPITD